MVCKRLVEMMHGAIGVESERGRGSNFWFELDSAAAPAVPSAPRGTQPAPLAAPSAHPRQHTLLYVEDNPANLLLVEDLVARRADIRFLSARDGRSGVELALTALPDVILMDINLPGISGVQALHLLATNPLTSAIPVVALSANAMPADIVRGLEAGFFRYLTKPIRVAEFMATLDEAMQFARASATTTMPGDPL